MRVFGLNCLFSFFLLLGLHAQKYTAYQFSSKHGISTEGLRAIGLDDKGFIWMGSKAGMFRFNGQKVDTFEAPLSRKNTAGFLLLPNEEFLAITSEGLVQIAPYDTPEDFSWHKSMKFLPETDIFNQVKSYALDPHGGIWIATDDVILQYQTKHWNSYFLSELPQWKKNSQIFMVASQDLGLWIFTSNALAYHFDRKRNTWKSFENPSSLTHFSAVAMDESGNILIGGKGISWLRFEQGKLVEKGYKPQGSLQNSLTKISFIPNNGFIAGNKNEGLFHISLSDSGLSFSQLFQNMHEHGVKSLLMKGIKDMMVSPNKEIWIGADTGLFFLERRYFQNFLQLPRDRSNFSLGPDQEALIAIGKVYEVWPAASNRQVKEIPLDFNQIGFVNSVCRNSAGLWMGNQKGQLFWQNPMGIIREIPFQIPGGSIFYLFPDLHSNVWVSRAPSALPHSGITKIAADGSPTHYGVEHGLEERLLVTYQAPDHTLLFGGIGPSTYLYTYAPEKDSFINLSAPLPLEIWDESFEVHDLTQDSSGAIWLASTHGLLKYANHVVETGRPRNSFIQSGNSKHLQQS